MDELVGYDLINKRIIIPNPFQYFFELKNMTKEEMVSKLLVVVASNKYRSSLYEHVLQYLNLGSNIEKIKNLNDDVNYLKEFSIVLRVLTSKKLIVSDYKVEYDVNKNISDIKIKMIEVTSEGVVHLNHMKSIRGETGIIEAFVARSKDLIEGLDSMKTSKEDLITAFEAIIKSITPLNIIDFHMDRKKDFSIDYFTGQFVIKDLDAFKGFILKQSHMQLEKVLIHLLNVTIDRVTNIKIILNAVGSNDFKSACLFMNTDDLLSNLLYMALEGYMHIDISYFKHEKNKSFKINVKNTRMTEKGTAFLLSKNLIEVRNNSKNVRLLTNALKKLSNQDDLNSETHDDLLKNLMASEHIH